MKIAVIGMACRYPDAANPQELWENVLARRRAFRRIPDERLRPADYVSDDRSDPDRAYCDKAAVIEGYEFDRVKFKVSGGTYRQVDSAHWLALDVASQALSDAGFQDGARLPKETTGVLLGNTLTGEFSRANLMRLRWPYVGRVLGEALQKSDWSRDRIAEFLTEVERAYKSPFPETADESLAGGLSNTIAGRICNYYDLKGGGYTVDGACAASLLAISNACQALTNGDLDCAIAGGVDLSLDPFEIVGFAKVGALAPEMMRVYDARSQGFWPGEGSGMVVLMRLEDALAEGHRVYAVVRGWGVSSDGSGGITRPEEEGQILALRRAYKRAGYGIDSVVYFEGHGTGTPVGDAVELATINRARAEADAKAAKAVIGSIKANIGHTKAAAGAAGFIKATLALSKQLLPPNSGMESPHAEFLKPESKLKPLTQAEPWPIDQPLRASVSAMGFGGINCHVTMEGIVAERREKLTAAERKLTGSWQDAELFILSAPSLDDLKDKAKKIADIAPTLSLSELTDLSVALASQAQDEPFRVAAVASSPNELAERIQPLLQWDGQGFASYAGAWAGNGQGGTVGFLFPGQAAPVRLEPGVWGQRFEPIENLFASARIPAGIDAKDTAVAQPSIIASTLAGLGALQVAQVSASFAIGHSLGEIAAFHWAGAMTASDAADLALERGAAMSAAPGSGAMASIAAGPLEVEELIKPFGDALCISGLNGVVQTVVSGESSAVDRLVEQAKSKGLQAVRLSVSHAFHSPQMRSAADRLKAALDRLALNPVAMPVYSTITGARLDADADLSRLLEDQLTRPVRFSDAVREASAQRIDLWIEVGPGRILSGLVSQQRSTPCISIDACGSSFAGLLEAWGACFVLGAGDPRTALADRFSRPFDLDRQPKFFVNPCELAPDFDTPKMQRKEALEDPTAPQADSPLECVRAIIAKKAELPIEMVKEESRLLRDLHLNSITVSQIVTEAAKTLGLPPPAAPTEYSNATVAELAQALSEMKGAPARPASIDGVEAWTRAFAIEFAPAPESSPKEGQAKVELLGSEALLKNLKPLHPDRDTLIVALDSREQAAELLLTAAHKAINENFARFVVIQTDAFGGGFAKSLKLERPEVSVGIVTLPSKPDWSAVAKEILAIDGFQEIVHDGRRLTPILKPVRFSKSSQTVIGDLILATGGGKGITAECALALAERFGARLAVIGRSDPNDDPELKANLERMAAKGVEARYYAADVTGDVVSMIRQIEKEMGAVSVLLHGAGVNRPKKIEDLSITDMRSTLAPKAALSSILNALSKPLDLLITFGSIIGRAGMPGNADYAFANEWMSEETISTDKAKRAICLEWSVWGGIGMGERLGVLEILSAQGVQPIPIDQGIEILLNAAQDPSAPNRMVVSGRFSGLPTLKTEQSDLPLLRFLETTLVQAPGVELIVEARLSPATDFYLDDHALQGQRIFPAVMALEAMAQTALGLTGKIPTAFADVRFDRAITVPDEGCTIRIASLLDGDKALLAVRSSETQFQTNHMSATAEFEPQESTENRSSLAPIDFDPSEEMYGKLLFQKGRFKRVALYRDIQAQTMTADLKHDAGKWFGDYLPAQLLLGDPGLRDASLHAIQACIPHSTLIPLSVEKIVLAKHERDATATATELERKPPDHTYELWAGKERWQGLRLREVAPAQMDDGWPAELVAPIVQRAIGGDLIIVGSQEDPAERLAQTIGAPITHRPDGKPEAKGWRVSVTHCGDLHLAVASKNLVAVDAERIDQSDIDWPNLLGERYELAKQIARQWNEPLETSQTRVWTALECLKKAGKPFNAPLTVADSGKLMSGDATIYSLALDSREGRLVVSVLTTNA